MHAFTERYKQYVITWNHNKFPHCGTQVFEIWQSNANVVTYKKNLDKFDVYNTQNITMNLQLKTIKMWCPGSEQSTYVCFPVIMDEMIDIEQRFGACLIQMKMKKKTTFC